MVGTGCNLRKKAFQSYIHNVTFPPFRFVAASLFFYSVERSSTAHFLRDLSSESRIVCTIFQTGRFDIPGLTT